MRDSVPRMHTAFELLLIRHGPAEPRPTGLVGLVDAERRLTAEGRERTTRVGDGLRRLEWRPSRIYSSPLVRAKETAQLIATSLELPQSTIVVTPTLEPDAEPTAFLSVLFEGDGPALGSTIACVGHADHIDLLLALLLDGTRIAPLKKAGVALVGIAPNLGHPGVARGKLLALLSPKILRRVGQP